MFVFKVPSRAEVIRRLGHSSVTSDGLEKLGIEPVTPSLHYPMAAPASCYNMDLEKAVMLWLPNIFTMEFNKGIIGK